jgi:hypothetical protein
VLRQYSKAGGDFGLFSNEASQYSEASSRRDRENSFGFFARNGN